MFGPKILINNLRTSLGSIKLAKDIILFTTRKKRLFSREMEYFVKNSENFLGIFWELGLPAGWKAPPIGYGAGGKESPVRMSSTGEMGNQRERR